MDLFFQNFSALGLVKVGPNVMALSSREKAETLSDSLEAQCKPNTDATISKRTVRIETEVEKCLGRGKEPDESLIRTRRDYK